MLDVKIAGLTYSILEKDNYEMNSIGLANFNTQEIWINNSHTKQTQFLAKIHEVLHIIDNVYGTELTEKQVTILAHGIAAFIIDNDQVIYDKQK